MIVKASDGQGFRNKSDLPGLGKRVVNLANAVVKIVDSGGEKVGIKEVSKRLSMCGECKEYYIQEHEQCTHPKCGCFLRIKTAYKAMNCPIGKW